MIVKKYRDYPNAALIILNDVFINGKSEGWGGSIKELEEVKTKLAPFNVDYTCDFTGTWRLKKQGTQFKALVLLDGKTQAHVVQWGDRLVTISNGKEEITVDKTRVKPLNF
jgi:hypothetical protein